MPIIQAFQGTILVEGNSRGEVVTPDPDTVIYSRKITAYGETIGELLDNLVEASVTIANDVFAWTTINKPEDYKLGDDYWYCHITHPEILDTSKGDPKTHSKDNDTGSGSSLDSVEYIVRFATLVRQIHAKSTASYLLLAKKSTPSEINEHPAVPYDGINNVTSFQEMTKFGFTGAELDTILEIGEREGRLKSYLEDLQFLRKHRMVKPEKPKQKWWKKLVA